MTLITFCSDDNYLYLLRPFLQSVVERVSNPKVCVIYYEYSLNNLFFLKKAYPFITFIKVDSKSTDPTYINSARLNHYLDVVQTLEKDTEVVLIDCDTIVLKDFSKVFENDFDVAFTYKEDKFPINFGVILGRNNSSFKEIVRYICKTIDYTFSDKELLSEATRLSGAADQHSINSLVHKPNIPPEYEEFSKKERDNTFGKRYNVEENGISIKIDFLPGEIFNETECKPISRDLNVIHYKSGWHPILKEIHKPKYTKYRSESECKEMFKCWAIFNNSMVENYFNFIFSELEDHLSALIENKIETWNSNSNYSYIVLLLALCRKLEIKSVVLVSDNESSLRDIIAFYSNEIKVLNLNDTLESNSIILIDSMKDSKSSKLIRNKFIANQNILLGAVISTIDEDNGKLFTNNFVLSKTLNNVEVFKYFKEILSANKYSIDPTQNTSLKESITFILPDGNKYSRVSMLCKASNFLFRVLRFISRKIKEV